MNILIEAHYFPSISYFSRISGINTYIEAWETYQKQTYRNRCYILGANDVQILTVPVKKAGEKKHIKEIKIDYSTNWQNIHLRSIVSSYGKAPFFEYYFDYIEQILRKRFEYLFDMNLEIIHLIIKLLDLDVNIFLTENYTRKVMEGVGFIDSRDIITPNQSFCQPKALEHVEYQQMFGKEFVRDLSIIDLLFCEGPVSKTFL